jgi:hypothetical protein
VPGLTYNAKRPGIAPRLKWRADCEGAGTCPELALALRAFDAAVLWDAARRPADEGRWAGAELLGRRAAGAVPGLGWQYLLRGGPPGLPAVRVPTFACTPWQYVNHV